MTATPLPSSAPVRLPPGFDYVELLGRGGNGYVVSARQIDLDRLVAIKMIFGGALAAGGVARLQREGRALARLSHPNVVRVFGALPMADDLALVLEFVEGGTLESALTSRRLDAAHSLSVLTDVAAAVAHCAEQGIVHRDLKPANILLTGAGRAKVADFGLARLSRAAAAFRTGSGVVSGTVQYMAPEQRDDPDREDPASDAYSFAVIAHRVLTGDFPYVSGQSQLSTQLDLQTREAFRQALHNDPAVRLRPQQLLDRLRAAPAPSWSYATPADRSEGPVAAPDQATAAGESTRSAPPPFAQRSPEVVVSAQSGQWVDVPVYAPSRRRPSPASSPRTIGILVGVLLVLLYIVVLAR
ncbi:MAG: serine/threonine-protein kinase [Actinomycetota bacterium]